MEGFHAQELAALYGLRLRPRTRVTGMATTTSGACSGASRGGSASSISADRELLPRVWDYVEHPKPDGYRAKHLVAIKDGMRIEVQLRTAPQHAWAELVERLDRRLGTRAKFGAADPQLAAALSAAAAVMVAFERGEVSLAATMRELQRVARATRGMT
jgi:hypothetical protein